MIYEEFKNLDNEEKIKLRGYYIWKINELKELSKCSVKT